MKIIKIPAVNGLEKTRGTETSPQIILEELKKISINEKQNSLPSKLDIEEMPINNENLEEQQSLIYHSSLKLFSSNQKLMFLGGDHSISFPIVKAFKEYYTSRKEKPFLIVFDAHLDLMPPQKEPTHEEWLRAVIESGFPKENILIIGARAYVQEEIDYATKNKIKLISLNSLSLDFEDFLDTITEFANSPLYISIDIDAIDPAFAPATGYPEPCGLTSRQALLIFSRLSLSKHLKAIDLVEINSNIDKERTTSKLAAKLASEFF